MSTPKSQRIIIWVITIVMTVGTLGAYFVIIFANDAEQDKNAQIQKQYQEYIKQQSEAAQKNAEASKPLDGYAADKFDAATVTTLQTADPVVGTGDEVKKDAKLSVSYFGWTPDGVIFDSSNKNGTNTPVDFTLSEGQLIAGWIEGIPGMKAGGVRKLTIPADKAYGATGQPPLIAPNTPLTFVVKVEAIK